MSDLIKFPLFEDGRVAPAFPVQFIEETFVYHADDAISNWLHHNAPDEIRELYQIKAWADEYVREARAGQGISPCMNDSAQALGGLWVMDALRKYWDADTEGYQHVRKEFDD